MPLVEKHNMPRSLDAANLPPAPESRASYAYRAVKQRIQDGTFPPGRRLPEKDVAELLDTSRTPVREAMNRLIAEGLLELHPMRGYAVVELDKQQILELFALREFLEGAAARYAAQHAADPEIQSLRQMSLDQRALDGDDVAGHVAINRRFHIAIVAAAHNRYLQEMHQRHSERTMLIPGTTYQINNRSTDSFAQHTAIVDAIEQRNPDKAEEAARDHVRKAALIRLKLVFGNS
jgi:DNA-binding GntR family transcriptional regulator